MIAARLVDAPIYAHCGNNLRVDIGAPDPRAVSFRLMAATLSKQARFDGRHAGGFAFSAAQHAVQGAQAIVNETRDTVAAGLFLLRDGHQWLLGDIAKPAQRLLSLKSGIDLDRIHDEVKAGWSEAIYLAAGLLPPSRWTNRQRDTVESMDDRMTRQEAIELFGASAAADFPKLTKPMTKGDLRPWSPVQAELAFLESLQRAAGRAHLN